MSSNHALIIGLEQYLSSEISKVEFAENDANGIYDALQNLDYDPENMTLLINQNATKTMIEFHFKKILKTLAKGDMMTIFFSGHGFYRDEDNYIVCHDTQPEDMISTSVSLSGMLGRLMNLCNLKLFLDVHHEGSPAGEFSAGINETNANESLSNSTYHTVEFVSSSANEFSYPNPALKHGAWSYHLIRALTGNAKEALEKNNIMTASSLQKYLLKSVPLSLMETFSVPKIQTPVIFGKYPPDYPIADLEEFLQRELNNMSVSANTSLEFVKRYSGRIKKLSGFKKTHAEPVEFTSSTQNFVRNISLNEINERTASLFNLIKSGFNLKHKDITSTNSGNFSTILTGDFEVDILLEQDNFLPNQYHETIILKNICRPEFIFDESFNRVFNSCFDTLIMRFNLSVGDFIDAIEEIQTGDISINYPPDINHASIDIRGIEGSIFVFDDRLEIKFTDNNKPCNFFETIMKVNKYLTINNCKFILLK